MRYYALLYRVVDDYAARRTAFREEHLCLAGAYHERGERLMGGAFADPPDAALLVWRVPDRSVIEQFVRRDPYVNNGLVTSWEIREWTVVVGAEPPAG